MFSNLLANVFLAEIASEIYLIYFIFVCFYDRGVSLFRV